MPPWKETDPSKPGFNVENFEYEDYLFYSPHNRMVYTLGYIFPLGTDRSIVERILVSYAEGKYEIINSKDCYVFKSSPVINWFMSADVPNFGHVCITYQDNKTQTLQFNGQYIYPRAKI